MIKRFIYFFFLDLIYPPFLICVQIYALIAGKAKPRMIRKRWGLAFDRGSNRCHHIWIHAASVGEMKLALKCADKLRDNGMSYQFLFSSNTQTGVDVGLLNKKKRDQVKFIPPDFSWCVNKVIRQYQVKALILIENEMWPNLIRKNYLAHGKIIVVNARMSTRSARRYSRIFFVAIFQELLKKLQLVLASGTEAAQNFIRLGVDSKKLLTTGNLKFPETLPRVNAHDKAMLRKKYALTDKEFLFVAGSVQPEELPYLAESFHAMQEKIEHLRMVIIPRHKDKALEFEKKFDALGLQVNVPIIDITHSRRFTAKILFIPEMNVLIQWYAIADCVFVGGSLCDRGGQNIIEPIALEAPTCTGDLAYNFRDEIETFEKKGAIRIVRDGLEIAKFATDIHTNSVKSEQIRQAGKEVLMSNSQAFPRTIELLQHALLSSNKKNTSATEKKSPRKMAH